MHIFLLKNIKYFNKRINRGKKCHKIVDSIKKI